MIDHLLWAVPELEEGCRQIARWTGVQPTPGGRHPGVGTHNALLSLGQGIYLEIIAPDPTQDRFSGLGELLRDLQTPTLLTWCALSWDIEKTGLRARSAGLTSQYPFAMSRRRPDGVDLNWRILLVEDHPFGPLLPFFIQWDSPEHPSQGPASGCTLEDFRLYHPAPSAVGVTLETLGLRMSVEEKETPGLWARLETPNGPVELPPASPEL